MHQKMSKLQIGCILFSFIAFRCSATNITIERQLTESCDWPMDLSFERDGSYQNQPSKNVIGSLRGRSGNTIIQYMVFRLNAASLGGFAFPWSGLVSIEDNNKNFLSWGPRFGKLAHCHSDSGYPCPKSQGTLPLISNQLPKSSAVQSCPRDDAKFHQNYEYFRGHREASRYFMATADDVSPEELQAWEKIMSPGKVWNPKRWLGPNDAVLHLRIFEDRRRVDKATGTPCDHGDKKTRAPCPPGSSVSLACQNALKYTHLCSWTRDLVDDALFTDGTCDEHLFNPPFSFYSNLFETRASREGERTGKPSVGPGGWDNVWLLSDPNGHNSELAKRLINELGVKVPFRHSDRGFSGPLEDIWNIKSAPYIIQSYGTFSWVGAYLSRAKEIHKPYTSNNWGNHWAEEAQLFVDDQEEYIYHNTEKNTYFMTAAEVMTETKSAFVQGVLNRPKQKMFPPIASSKEVCESRKGKWTDCSAGIKEASCRVNGTPLFTAPCHRACYDT